MTLLFTKGTQTSNLGDQASHGLGVLCLKLRAPQGDTPGEGALGRAACVGCQLLFMQWMFLFVCLSSQEKSLKRSKGKENPTAPMTGFRRAQAHGQQTPAADTVSSNCWHQDSPFIYLFIHH